MGEAVRERHRHHGGAGVGEPGRDRKQQSPAVPPGGQQAGRCDRDGDHAGNERSQSESSWRLTGRMAVRPEQGEDGADRRHDREDRRPAAAGQRPPGETAAHCDADEQRAAEDHLHRGQRSGPQRRGVRDEAAGFQGRAGQPQRLPGQQGQHPRPASRLSRQARGLPVFECDSGPVQHGGQCGEQ
jgi:hypothetical protein